MTHYVSSINKRIIDHAIGNMPIQKSIRKKYESIFGRRNAPPSAPVKIYGKPLYKRNGKPLSIQEWQAFEASINKFLNRYTHSIPEETAVKAFLIGLLDEKENKKPYKEIETDFFNGYIPDTKHSANAQYQLDTNANRLIDEHQTRIASYLATNVQELKNSVRPTNKSRTPSKPNASPNNQQFIP